MEESRRTRLVEAAPEEPRREDLEQRRSKILAKLREITPDQLERFATHAADLDVAGEGKAMWEKTIWEK